MVRFMRLVVALTIGICGWMAQPVQAGEPCYAVAFVDTGTVEQRVTLADFRVSAGCGLRIRVPVLGPAPLQLDLSFPITKPQDNQQLFNFILGVSR
jgi:outer membrane translocation and assembly module TamA